MELTAGGGGVGSGRIEMRARVMLAEVLVENGGTTEAEKVLSKGVSLLQSWLFSLGYLRTDSNAISPPSLADRRS